MATLCIQWPLSTLSGFIRSSWPISTFSGFIRSSWPLSAFSGHSLHSVDSETAHDYSHLSLVHVRPVQRELDTCRIAEKEETVPETINLEYLYPSRPCLCFHPQSFPFFSLTRAAGRAGGVGWGVWGGRWEGVWGVGVGGAPSESITESNRFSLLGFETGKYLMEN